ncbi:MAG: ABC transporter substrate-binding protein [Anaerolineae bacterium]
MSPSTREARYLALAAALLAAFLLLLLFARQQRPPRLYRLGLVAPFEGLYRDTGYAALAAARVRAQEWNRDFARYGFYVQVWAVDDSNDPALAILRAQELADDPLVLAVVGHLTPETSAATTGIYREAGLLQVSPVPSADHGEGGGAGLTLSPEPAPDAVFAAVSSVVSKSAWLVLPTGRLWQPPVGACLYTSLADATGADTIYLNAPLLAVTRELVEGGPTAKRLVFPYGYCPRALQLMFPKVSFWALTNGQSSDGKVNTITASAADLALQAILRAAESGHLSRPSVSQQARTFVTEQGWQQYQGDWYPPDEQVVLISCPAK